MNQILLVIYLVFLLAYIFYSYLLFAYIKKFYYLGSVNNLVSTIYIIVSLVIINASLIAFFIGGGSGN